MEADSGGITAPAGMKNLTVVTQITSYKALSHPIYGMYNPILAVTFSALIHLVLSLFPSHPGTVTQVCTPTLLACSRRLDEREWFEGCGNCYSYGNGHLLVIVAGCKWDYTFYKWGFC